MKHDQGYLMNNDDSCNEELYGQVTLGRVVRCIYKALFVF